MNKIMEIISEADGYQLSEKFGFLDGCFVAGGHLWSEQEWEAYLLLLFAISFRAEQIGLEITVNWEKS